jgi:hypothetical protein
MSEDTITAVAVLETEYGEKVVLDSPFEAKDFINALPWKTLPEEADEHGSLRAKLEKRDVDDAAIQAAEDFEFSEDFAGHASWEPDTLGGDGAWAIDVSAFDEAREFFEFVGYDVENETNL